MNDNQMTKKIMENTPMRRRKVRMFECPIQMDGWMDGWMDDVLEDIRKINITNWWMVAN